MGSNHTSRVLTRDVLLSKDPCSTYRRRFATRFPEGGVVVTVDLAMGQAEDWDWFWAASYLLDSRSNFDAVAEAADAEYYDTIRPLQEVADNEYNKHYEAYSQIKNDALRDGKGYNEAYELAAQYWENCPSAVFNAAVGKAREEANKILNRKLARAFAEQFIAERAEGEPDEVPAKPEVPEGEYYCDMCATTHTKW